MRIAQPVIAKSYRVKITEREISSTKRGSHGFGSTGI